MKPVGPIPPGFVAAVDGMLAIGGHPVETLVAQAGHTPLFVYDAALVRLQAGRFRAAMPRRLQLHYAIKANPFAPLLVAMTSLVDGFDVASAGELDRALAAGMAASRISFAGPGKRDPELAAAIKAGVTVNLESTGEATRAIAIAAALSIRPRLAVRVNPDFELKGSGMRMGGGPKPFGIDSEQVPALVRGLLQAGADWQGYHVFAGSQVLDPAALIEAQNASLDLVAALTEEVGTPPPLVNLGGGFGVPYFAGMHPLDLDPIGANLRNHLQNLPEALQQTRFALELGRWLVAEAGIYITRIVDRKTSRGHVFLVCDGGMHHQLAASGNLGAVVRRNYPIALASNFRGEPDVEPASVVGPLCTPLDILGDSVALPPANVGDLIAVFLAGAYGLTASPTGFLGHPAPRELLVSG